MLSLPCVVPDRLLQSQLGQDRFVVMALEGKTGGTFVDIGAGQPWHLSNTIAGLNLLVSLNIITAQRKAEILS